MVEGAYQGVMRRTFNGECMWERGPFEVIFFIDLLLRSSVRIWLAIPLR